MTTPMTMLDPELRAALPAGTPAAVQPLNEALRVPLGLLVPSPLNPRKHRSEEHVRRLAHSLTEHGQMQPIRIRRNAEHTATNGRAPYEIVVGVTRWLAAQQAGLPALDAVEHDCTDQQVIELGLAENTDRDPLHPLEEAAAFESLMRKPDGLQGYATVPELAARFGRSPSYVYQRLKLLALGQAGRDAFLAGHIDASVALLIARMPDHTEQARATSRILAGFGGEPFSYRSAAEYLQRNYMLKLQVAKFDTAAAYKVAGPCSECPKRSGASADLFPDITSGDMCQDARCYLAKTEEQQHRLIQLARDAGHTVLQGAAARRVLPNPAGAPVGHYRTAEPCPLLTDSRKPLGDLLPKTVARVFVEHPEATGTLVELVAEADVKTALKKKGLLRQATAPAPSPTTKAKPPASSSSAELTAAGPASPSPRAAATPHAVVTPSPQPAAPAADFSLPPEGTGGEKKAEEQARERRFAGLLAKQINNALIGADDERWSRLGFDVLRMAVSLMAHDLSVQALELLYQLRGWHCAADCLEDDDLEARLQSASGRTLGELLGLLLVIEELTDAGVTPQTLSEDGAELADRCEIDLGRLWRQAVVDQFLADNEPATGHQQPTDATEAFLQQHGQAAVEKRETRVATEAEWPWPGDGNGAKAG